MCYGHFTMTYVYFQIIRTLIRQHFISSYKERK